jgi:hypothetical protein
MVRRVLWVARLVPALALWATAAFPSPARAAPRLLDAELRAGPRAALAVDGEILAHVVLARAQDGAQPAGGGGSLDFDLLGEAQPPPEAPDARRMKLRRTMLTWHQGTGFALLGLQLGATVLGQLSYNDKFGGSAPANTNKYRLPHAVLSYGTLGAFVGAGTLALLAPSPVRKERRFDRVMVHRIAMFTAAAGMAAQAGLGIYTAKREGYLDQEDKAQLHLAIGYATLAAVATGVGALVL